MAEVAVRQNLTCTHCGDVCRDDFISIADSIFCCAGCKAVYELLHHAELGAYYGQQAPPGLKPTQESDLSRFAYLDDPAVISQLIDFSDGHTSRITLSVPQMHCSSCIWLLENLFRLHPAIAKSQVNFLRHEVTMQFDHNAGSLREIVELLARLGYEPLLRLDKLGQTHKTRDPRKALYLKVGIAGFCFGNVMLLSFPDYINSQELARTVFPFVFRYVMLALALPVLLYSAREYFRSAYLGIRSRALTIDLPLALGLASLFLRSVYDIVSGNGPGYLDSFTGLVFFLLLGKVFQQRTYERLSFERDYRAYFPASITRKQNDGEFSVPITKLAVGDRIIVRNQELIPADAILIRGEGFIDYSFVTGESEPQAVSSGGKVFAGGRQAGTAVELEIVKEVSQSYLTSLWNNVTFQKGSRPQFLSLADRVGRYFIAAVLLIALATAAYWLRRDAATAATAVTAVLIVACPCALALSSPFVLGTAVRILGRHKLYIKNTAVVEALSSVDSIVFDKTGTLTSSQPRDVDFDGAPLTPNEQALLKSLVRHSTHPASRCIASSLQAHEMFPVESFTEEPGNGIAGRVASHEIRLGRYGWTQPLAPSGQNGFRGEGTVSYLVIDGLLRGKFLMSNAYREGLKTTVTNLRERYSLSVVSGDTDRERSRLTSLYGNWTALGFNQSPHDKLQYIDSLQKQSRQVLMVGDGLNDAGALKAASVGVAVSEDAVTFTPACDAILEASHLPQIDKFLALARASRTLIVASFGLSLMYNIIGLSFAVSGHLSPLVSAVLMPISSVSVIAFATISTHLAARRIGLA